jgi:UDP-N-acetylglucosamine 2-epimerase (non-hydrolysing)
MIAVVFGTRPEIIKLSPVIRALREHRVAFYTVHTGQHYSYNLDRIFIESLGLPEPTYHLAVGSGPHGAQTAEIIRRVEEVVSTDPPDVVLVQGDTNSVLGAAIACAKLHHVRVGHVEAGLRSYDRTMPEEVNRVLTDHVSDLLFAPTPTARRILLGEGIPEDKIWMTGNTIVDAVQENLAIAYTRSTILAELSLKPKSFMVLTLHRPENVADAARLGSLVRALNALSDELGMPIVCPMHPRTRGALAEHRPPLELRVVVIDPVGYFDALVLQEQARLVLTDSGGMQEEACILGTPCVTLRENTERPETLEVGANCLGGFESESIRRSVEAMLTRDTNWPNPFGDGRAGERIAAVSAAVAWPRRAREHSLRPTRPNG